MQPAHILIALAVAIPALRVANVLPGITAMDVQALQILSYLCGTVVAICGLLFVLSWVDDRVQQALAIVEPIMPSVGRLLDAIGHAIRNGRITVEERD